MSNLDKRLAKLETANGEMTPEEKRRWERCIPELRAAFSDDGTPEGQPRKGFTWEDFVRSLDTADSPTGL